MGTCFGAQKDKHNTHLYWAALMSQQRKAKLCDVGILNTDNDLSRMEGENIGARGLGRVPGSTSNSSVALDKKPNLLKRAYFSHM